MTDLLVNYLARGGPLVWPILVTSLVLYSLLAERWLFLARSRPPVSPRPGKLNTHDASAHAACLQVTAGTEFTRHLNLIRVLIVIAPLLGLLGTVSGIIGTFDAILAGHLGNGFGSGIATALITTQLGLAVAVPGVVIERLLSRRAQYLHACAAQTLTPKQVPA